MENKDSRSIEDLHLELAEAFNYALAKFLLLGKPIRPFLTQTYRPDEVQDKLYKIGRTKGKKGAFVTMAKAGQSPHNFNPSRAFDIGFKNGKKMDWTDVNFKTFADILLEKYGKTITWGGNFNSARFRDLPHFELTNWKKIK